MLNDTLSLAIRYVNTIKSKQHALNTEMFKQLRCENDEYLEILMMHTEVRQLSDGNFWTMFVSLFRMHSCGNSQRQLVEGICRINFTEKQTLLIYSMKQTISCRVIVIKSLLYMGIVGRISEKTKQEKNERCRFSLLGQRTDYH